MHLTADTRSLASQLQQLGPYFLSVHSFLGWLAGSYIRLALLASSLDTLPLGFRKDGCSETSRAIWPLGQWKWRRRMAHHILMTSSASRSRLTRCCTIEASIRCSSGFYLLQREVRLNVRFLIKTELRLNFNVGILCDVDEVSIGVQTGACLPHENWSRCNAHTTKVR